MLHFSASFLKKVPLTLIFHLKKRKKNEMQVLFCPCFEAMLLVLLPVSPTIYVTRGHKKLGSLIFKASESGISRTRTYDPHDVNVVL